MTIADLQTLAAATTAYLTAQQAALKTNMSTRQVLRMILCNNDQLTGIERQAIQLALSW